MKKLKYLSLLLVAFSIVSKSYCQIEKDKSEKNFVDVPYWFSNRENEKIRKIEAMDTLGYHEYIQLSVSYAEIGNRVRFSESRGYDRFCIESK